MLGEWNLKFFSRVVYFWTGFFLEEIKYRASGERWEVVEGRRRSCLGCRRWCSVPGAQAVILEVLPILVCAVAFRPHGSQNNLWSVGWGFGASSLPLPKPHSSHRSQPHARGSKSCWSSSSSMAGGQGTECSRSTCLVRGFPAASAPKSNGSGASGGLSEPATLWSLRWSPGIAFGKVTGKQSHFHWILPSFTHVHRRYSSVHSSVFHSTNLFGWGVTLSFQEDWDCPHTKDWCFENATKQ